MKDRKFKAFFIISIMLFVLAVITIFKLPDVWPFIAGPVIAGLVGVGTTFFTGNVAHAWQKSKNFIPEMQKGEKDENS